MGKPDARWSDPESVVDEDLAKEVIHIARIVLTKHETTKREIDIWIECLGRDVMGWTAPARRKSLPQNDPVCGGADHEQ